ncbi:MAG: N-glycosylase/DNA lyase [Candidatus Cloacimonetes bacterium]|nr:N-glycosylase/DNA lyase [Candidatus Cloacimonadota bacterium]
MNDYIVEIKEIYSTIKGEIQSRLDKFKQIGLAGNDEDIFAELVFCILTPQSRAKICWKAVQNLIKKNLLFNGNENQIAKELYGVRYHNNKSRYIVEARAQLKNFAKVLNFRKGSINKTREWLVKNIKGFGYKEASHFLRNIGFGENIAILDRHILKNLKLLNVIDEIPKVLLKNKYLVIEKKIRKFSEEINISLNHLDLVLWYKETGEIFK